MTGAFHVCNTVDHSITLREFFWIAFCFLGITGKDTRSKGDLQSGALVAWRCLECKVLLVGECGPPSHGAVVQEEAVHYRGAPYRRWVIVVPWVPPAFLHVALPCVGGPLKIKLARTHTPEALQCILLRLSSHRFAIERQGTPRAPKLPILCFASFLRRL